MRLFTYGWLALGLGLTFAAIGWLGIAGWLAAVVIAASVAAHVAGNALGTRLRDEADRRRTHDRPPRRHEPLPAAPPTHLERRTSLGRLVPVSVGIGATCGGIAGSYALAVGVHASLAGTMLGGVSSAVIGGLGGFLVASFVEAIRTSLREAIAAERRG